LGRSRIAEVAALVGPGEWTTYGEIARVALGGRGARVVGGAAARGQLANAHRVLLSGGRISPGGGEGWAAEVRRRLAAEGVGFKGARADPRRHVTWLDLEARLGDEASQLGGRVG
jgi:alkylated DNA nucleotide flippase Atl1